MEKTELVKAVAAWQEQDKENRTVFCVMTEKTGEDKVKSTYSNSAIIAGQGENLVAMFKQLFRNDKDLVKLMKKTFEELSFEQFLKECMKEINDIKKEEE